MVNEEVVKIENISTKEEEHKDNQTLRNIEVRDLTDEESKRFSERIKTTSKVALEENYSAVEFDFGKVERVFKNKSFIKFDEDNSYFILNDEKVLEKLYQIVNYEIEKTNTLSHKNILKKDTDQHINLLNKFTKITKTELKNILKDTSIKNFIKNPEEYISDKDNLQKINILKELQNQYFSKANKFSIENTRIKSPDDIQDFIMTRYDNINVALYLDTKNTIIESEILPENLTSKEESKHIIERAILHDSNSFALSTKTNASHIRYSEESIDRVSNIKRLADLVGINLIDNVAVNNLSSLSYKGSHLLEPKEKYKAKIIEKVKKGCYIEFNQVWKSVQLQQPNIYIILLSSYILVV